MSKEYIIVNAVLEEDCKKAIAEAGEYGILIPLNTRDTTKEKEQKIYKEKK